MVYRIILSLILASLFSMHKAGIKMLLRSTYTYAYLFVFSSMKDFAEVCLGSGIMYNWFILTTTLVYLLVGQAGLAGHPCKLRLTLETGDIFNYGRKPLF